MTEFVLNRELHKTELPKGMVLLDYIRSHAHLKGTKITCREGDCGACTVLLGTLKGEEIHYNTIVSCISPLGMVHGKHVVTIEGVNVDGLNPVQQFLQKNHATQCGFCTPGFIMSLTGSLLHDNKLSIQEQVSGNICRCTGYKSIINAISDLEYSLQLKNFKPSLKHAVSHGFVQDYFLHIPEMLKKIPSQSGNKKMKWIGGATDLFVQKPDKLHDQEMYFTLDNQELKYIEIEQKRIRIGASVTTSEILESELLNTYFSSLKEDMLLISSQQIRNTATVGGNLINASPIGDLAIWFLALDGDVELFDLETEAKRLISLKDFFIEYKVTAIKKDEILTAILFDIPENNDFFSFEKVSKRTYLDIASVNSACNMKMENGRLKQIYLSAGGVAPVPLRLRLTENFLNNKKPEAANLIKAIEIMFTEIRPIDDIRGSAMYKKLLLRQLFLAHFEKIVPDVVIP